MLFAQLVDNRLHLVLIETFAGVAVELYPEKVVCLADLLERYGFEPFKYLDGFGIVLFYALKPCARAVV